MDAGGLFQRDDYPGCHYWNKAYEIQVGQLRVRPQILYKEEATHTTAPLSRVKREDGWQKKKI